MDGSAAVETYSADQCHRIVAGLILFSGVAMAGMMSALKYSADLVPLLQIMALRDGVPFFGALPCRIAGAGMVLLAAASYAALHYGLGRVDPDASAPSPRSPG